MKTATITQSKLIQLPGPGTELNQKVELAWAATGMV